MCGRAYETYTDEELQMRYLNKKRIKLPDFKPNYNLSPTQLSPIVLVKDGERTIEMMRWGLIPSWANTVKDASKYSLINAKAEEIETKRSYAGPFKQRRCIWPISGFYEWLRGDGKTKRPFAIHLKDEPIISVAGVWEHWESKETGEIVDSFSVLTTAANPFMEKIHDRMPVIVDRANEAEWLDPEIQDVARLKKLIHPIQPERMAAYEVSTLVNSPKNNRPEVLEPVDAI